VSQQCLGVFCPLSHTHSVASSDLRLQHQVTTQMTARSYTERRVPVRPNWQPTHDSAFTGDPASACTACPTGKYKDTTGIEECTGCPTYSSSQPGGDTLADCHCETGYSGQDGVACLACVARSYKATAGSASCTFCGVGFYSNDTAAASCVSCPSDSYSVEGSTRHHHHHHQPVLLQPRIPADVKPQCVYSVRSWLLQQHHRLVRVLQVRGRAVLR
jgi:hypothetical protein